MGIDNATPVKTEPQPDDWAKAGQSGAQAGNSHMRQQIGAKGKGEPRTEDDSAHDPRLGERATP